jgi:hypothetical protein
MIHIPYRMKAKNFIWVILAIFFQISCDKNEDKIKIEEGYTFTISTSKLSLVENGHEKLWVTFEDGATHKIDWSSSNDSVASVDSGGIVTALSEGDAEIYAVVRGQKQQCHINVIKSPISNLLMPDLQYPIAKNASFLIQGIGFTSNSKIWFYKNNKYATSLKSSQDDDKILATIHEQTEKYLLVNAGINDGRYSVLLEEDGGYYNLGSIEVVTPDIGEYEYDKEKIFWDDTHWRRMQLRGNVKNMAVTGKFLNFEYDNGPRVDFDIEEFNFNEKGYLVSYKEKFNRNFVNDSTVLEYDYKNRPTLITRCLHKSYGYEVSIYEYTYGNHDLYYPIGCAFIWFNDYLNKSFGFIVGINDNKIWVQGLKKISYKNFQTDFSSNLIVTTITTYGDDSQEELIYNGLFPVSGITKEKKKTEVEWHFSQSDNYEFTSTGCPITNTTTYLNGKTYNTYFITNSPFYLYSEDDDNYFTGHYKCEYDINWNLTKVNFYDSNESIWDFITITYNSYDEKGNWTSCYVREKNNYEDNLWTVTRDFAYY